MTARWMICAFALLLSACTPTPQVQPPSQAEVEAFVHQYADATRSGDASKAMGMISREPGVSSAGAGMIFRGWETIQKVTGETIADARETSIAIGAIDVTPLGPDTVLAVFPMQLGTPPRTVEGAGTIVIKRTPEGLRVIHEHYSLRDA